MRARSFFNNLREASFRGARFEVDEVEASGGRRVVLHEYPLRDTPYSEDLGRRAREFSVRGYIIQGRTYDYASARADVLKALEAYGPGEPFRRESVISPVCRGVVAGFGMASYVLAAQSFIISQS